MSSSELPARMPPPLADASLSQGPQFATPVKGSAQPEVVHRISFGGEESELRKDDRYHVAAIGTFSKTPPAPTKFSESVKQWFLEKMGYVVVLKVKGKMGSNAPTYVKVNATSLRVRLGLDKKQFDAVKHDSDALGCLVGKQVKHLEEAKQENKGKQVFDGLHNE